MENSYDAVPYPSHAYPQTHPDHLATLAILSGMSPAPVENCRVLELGCGAGGNLIPMAYGLPHSQFVGIDLSGRAIADGQAWVSALGLKNITLEHKNVLDVDVEAEPFDYIIVYGIYSWVPAGVQQKIFKICRRLLAPNGVAYFSYNAYPGWHLNTIIRDMLIYRTRNIATPEEKIKVAQQWFDYVIEIFGDENTSLYANFFKSMHKFLADKTDSYIFHDFMEDINEPLYFYQFVEQAQAHDLQYLANAEFTVSNKVNAEVTNHLFEISSNIIEVEQHLDFLTNNMFRETVLCHKEITVNRTLKPEIINSLLIASQVQPDIPNLNIHTTERVEFSVGDESSLSTAHPLTKAALRYLAEVWPRAVPFNELFVSAAEMLHPQTVDDAEREILATNLLMTYSQNMKLISLHTFTPQFVTTISNKPTVCPPARLQAEQKYPVTNMYHRRVAIDDPLLHLLPHMDGTKTHADLLDILTELTANGTLTLSQDDTPVTDVTLAKQILADKLDVYLQHLAQTALLIG